VFRERLSPNFELLPSSSPGFRNAVTPLICTPGGLRT
jgi:hypothetical protein